MSELTPPALIPHERSLFITHHTPDMDNVSLVQFERIVPELQRLGFSKHRFDVRWQTASPSRHEVNDTYLGRAALLAQTAHRQGLEPIVILSTPPKWAYRHKTPEQIREYYSMHAKNVKRHFDRLNVPIKTVQILNEINNPIYTPRKLLKELPNLAAATREVFGEETDVTATILLAKPWTNAERFLKRHQKELSSLTSVGLDFYPGVYQYNRKIISPKGTAIVTRQALEAIATKATRNVQRDFLSLLKEQVTDMRSFRKLLQIVQDTLPNAHIDIGEFGFPTLDPIQRRNPRHEALQSYAVEKIAQALVPIVNEYSIRNVGFYELFDDKELGILNWGILNDKGEAKNIISRLPIILQSLKTLQS